MIYKENTIYTITISKSTDRYLSVEFDDQKLSQKRRSTTHHRIILFCWSTQSTGASKPLLRNFQWLLH